MKNKVYQGFITEGHGDCEDTICIDNEPISEDIEIDYHKENK